MIRSLALALSLAGGCAWAESAPLLLAGPAETLAFVPSDILDLTGESFGPMIDLTVAFGPDAGARLADFTAKHAGQDIAILSCGTEVTRVTVIEPIKGGRIVLAGLDEAQANAIGAAILGQAPCP